MKVNQPLIISLLLHFCLLLLAMVTPSSPILTPVHQDIEVVYQNEKIKDRQFVTETSDDLQKEIEKIKEKAKFLSKVARRVKEEQIARRSGETVNRGQQRSALSSPQTTAQQIQKENFENTERPSITAPSEQIRRQQVGQNARLGDSTISEYIPNVKEGGFTSLNQDQFIYYTFYSRINEQIRNRWINNIRQFLDENSQAEINRLSARPQITQVEVLITQDGHYVKTLIHRRAEDKNLDSSVIAAFRLASPFQNPPLELLSEDGYIHLHYAFHLQFRPRYLASGP